MLTCAEADDLIDRHLGAGFRAEHSRLVGVLMRGLAAPADTDAALWEVTGLCHDLDYDVTRETPEQHGLVVGQWLRNQLPADALLAIAAHDHQTGVRSDAPLGHALKLADALAILCAGAGPAAVIDALRSKTPAASLLALDPSRPWLAEMILGHAGILRLAVADLASLLGKV